MSKDVALEESDHDYSMTVTADVPYQRNTLLRLRCVFPVNVVPSVTNSTRPRAYVREPFAEFLGVCILIIFGTGVDCQVVLSGDTKVISSPRGVCITPTTIQHITNHFERATSQSTLDGPLVQLWVSGWQVAFLGPILILLRVPVFYIFVSNADIFQSGYFNNGNIQRISLAQSPCMSPFSHLVLNDPNSNFGRFTFLRRFWVASWVQQ